MQLIAHLWFGKPSRMWFIEIRRNPKIPLTFIHRGDVHEKPKVRICFPISNDGPYLTSNRCSARRWRNHRDGHKTGHISSRCSDFSNGRNPAQLENQGIASIKDLSSVASGFNIQSSQTETQGTSIRIRGVGTTGNNIGLESAVGVFIDGVYQSRPGVALGELSDIEALELLRGPQALSLAVIHRLARLTSARRSLTLTEPAALPILPMVILTSLMSRRGSILQPQKI